MQVKTLTFKRGFRIEGFNACGLCRFQGIGVDRLRVVGLRVLQDQKVSAAVLSGYRREIGDLNGVSYDNQRGITKSIIL